LQSFSRVTTLPPHITSTNVGVIAHEVIGQEIPDSLDIDCSRLTTIQSCGIAYLGNITEWLLNQSCQVNFTGLGENSSPAIDELRDAGFVARCCGALQSNRLNPLIFPLESITRAKSRPYVEAEFIPWLAGQTGYLIDHLSGLHGALAELFNNVEDHTEYDVGCLHARHYPEDKRVLVTVADFGCGIPYNVLRLEPNLSEAAAIVKATQLKFTTGGQRNRGMGLDQVLTHVIKLNQGVVTIRSGKGSVAFSADSDEIGNKELACQGRCFGTMIEISVPTNREKWFGGNEGPEDFGW